MSIIIHTLTISLWCCGIFAITDEGQVLYFINEWAQRFQGWKRMALKPVILCVTCMASVHGLALSWLLGVDAVTAIISIISAAFVNTILWNLYRSL